MRSDTDEQRGRTGAAGALVLGRTDIYSLGTVAFALLVFSSLAGTQAALDGALEETPVLAGYGVGLGGFMTLGILASAGFPHFLTRIGYRVKRTVSFRHRPLWSLLIGYATFLLVLLLIGLIVVGIWRVSTDPIIFLLVLGVLAVIVALYLRSTADVGFRPSASGEGGLLRSGTHSRSLVSGIRVSGAGEGRLDIGRTVPVLRGWLTIAVLLTILTVGAIALWQVGGGPVGFLVGLLVVCVVAAGYAVAMTWS